MKGQETASAYHRVKNRGFYASLALDILFLSGLFFFGISLRLQDFVAGLSSSAWVINGLYIGVVAGAMYLVHFPLNFFLTFTWEHRFQLSNQGVKDWLVDDLKKAFLSFAVLLVLVEVIYALLRRFPGGWWIGAGLFWLFLSLFLARIMPQIIIPLFYKYFPLDNQQLKDRLVALFRKSGVPVQDVYGIDFSRKTKKANAFICGLGRQRRVVLSDTLLHNFSIPQIETVVAHELGHYRHRDILKLLAAHTAVIFLAFFLVDKFLRHFLTQAGELTISDIAAFPMLALSMVILGVVTTPLLNAFSRFLETKADAFCLEATRNAEEFIAVMEKLGEMNLAERHPGRMTVWMFYDHPPLAQRIAWARSFRPAV